MHQMQERNKFLMRYLMRISRLFYETQQIRYHFNSYTPVICVCNNDALRDLNRGIAYNYGFHRRISEGLMLVHYAPV